MTSTTLGTRVWVALDGTPFAEQALPVARLVARLADGSLVLAHVVEPPAPVSEVQGALAAETMMAAATLRELRRAAQDYLDDVVARMTRGERARAPDGAAAVLPTAPPSDTAASPVSSGDAAPSAAEELRGRFGDVPSPEVPVRGVLLEGHPTYDLHAAAAAAGADLLVLASHDRSALTRLLLGSTAEQLAREPGIPVLIVRRPERDARDRADDTSAVAVPELDATTVEAARFRHVLVPLDGSPEAEAVLSPALALAGLTEAAVTLASVRDPRRDRLTTLLPTALLAPGADEGRTVDVGAEAAEELDAYLGAVSSRLAAEGWQVGTRVVDGHDVAAAIVQGAADVGADLIALSTHGRGGWDRLVLGSVTESLLHRVLMPVLVLRPPFTPSDH